MNKFDVALDYLSNEPYEFICEYVLKSHLTGIRPTSQQKRVLDALPRSIENGEIIAVKSGHGTGKTALASWIILWFMFTRPFSLIPCTAPTQHQLFDVLWKELSIWHGKSMFKDLFEWRPTSFIHKKYSATWKAIARTAKDPEGLAGKHAEQMIFMIDEASGVESNIFETVMGTQTQASNAIIMFSNPTKTSGFFHELFTNVNMAHRVLRFTFSSKESTNVKPEFVQQIIDMYGEDSDEYRVRVLGEFPIAEFDTLIPYDLVENASRRQIIRPPRDQYEYVELGIDVARFGDDKTECFSRINNVIETEFTIHKSDLMYIVAKTMETINAKYKGKQIIINVDDTGVGGGVTDRLREHLRNDLFRGVVNAVNNGSSPNDPRFLNLVTEMWYFMKKWLATGRIPEDNELMKQLCNRKKSMTSAGKNVLERKEQMKARDLASPDKADAAILTLFSLVHKVKKGKRCFIC